MTVKTSKIKGMGDYALVPDRLKKFREDNPRAKVSTRASLQEDGGLIFQATILTDKADPSSAESTGTAMYTAEEMKKSKSFEKLETVSVGRALSLLGYLNNGQVASTEEMLEFEEYKSTKREEAISEGVSRLSQAKDIEELKSIYMSLGNVITENEVVEAKNKRKEELSK